jgi:hypothetical protein
MKGSMKKLAVFVVIGAIATFIAAAIASADDKDWKTLHGQYASTGETTCLIAPLGFNPNLTPKNGLGVIQTSSREGVFTFEHHGKGSADMFSRNVILPYQLPDGTTVPPSAGTQEITFDFTYTLKDDGTITIVVGPGPFTSAQKTGPEAGVTFYITGVSMNGVIAPDGKTITLNGGAPDVLTIKRSDNPNFNAPSICHTSGVLIWQQNERPWRD